MIKLVKTFTYLDWDCTICKVTRGTVNSVSYLTAYVHLPEFSEYYEKEMARVPDYLERTEEPLDDYLSYAPYVTFIGMFDSTKVSGYNHEVVSDEVFSVGLDLPHLCYLELNDRKAIDLAESFLKDMVDYIADNYEEIEKIVSGER